MPCYKSAALALSLSLYNFSASPSPIPLCSRPLLVLPFLSASLSPFLSHVCSNLMRIFFREELRLAFLNVLAEYLERLRVLLWQHTKSPIHFFIFRLSTVRKLSRLSESWWSLILLETMSFSLATQMQTSWTSTSNHQTHLFPLIFLWRRTFQKQCRKPSDLSLGLFLVSAQLCLV